MKHKYSLIIASLIMMLSIVVPAAVFLEAYTERKIMSFEKSELAHIAKAVDLALPNVGGDGSKLLVSARLSRVISQMATALEARVTLIDAAGSVFADSARGLAQITAGENFVGRPEIEQAHIDGSGYAVRYSDTLGYKVMHVVLRVSVPAHLESHIGGDSVLIRTTRPLSKIDETIAGFHNELLKIGAAISLLAILMSVTGVFFLNRQMKCDSESLEERVEQRTDEIVMLQMLNSLLNTCASLSEAATVLVELVPKLLPGVSGGISIFKASRNRLDLLCEWGPNYNGGESLKPHDCWSLRKGHQHQARDHGILLPCDHWQGEASETVCIPLLAQGETVGALHLDYKGYESLQPISHIRNAIGEQVGLTLANIQLRQQLREQARRDPMTGLYNRLHLGEQMDTHFQSAAAPTAAVLMIDADHFKRFNDNFGHDAGDIVLKSIASEIRRESEGIALACRYGGEEFCLFAADRDEATVMRLAESIRRGVAGLNLSVNNLPLGTVTVSIGVAFAPDHASDAKSLIAVADSALYSAKESGRDQVKRFAVIQEAQVALLKVR